MSWEAWGSDDPPTQWEETLAHEEFVKVRKAFLKWSREHGEQFGPEGAVVLDRIEAAMDEFQAGWLTGEI